MCVRTISAVRTQLNSGYVTEAAVPRPCNGGEAWILNGRERLPLGETTTNTLPWHLQYDSFRGRLPTIEGGIRLALIGTAWRIRGTVLNIDCVFGSTAESPSFAIANLGAGGAAESLRSDEESQVPLRERIAGSCPSSGSFAGTTSTLDNGTAERITIRLI